ncbi:MAG: hypothetical protein WDO14_08285 [Bacteroidota bacterium]
MISPFICYSVSFAAALLIYLLGWSELYPKLSVTVVVFLLMTIIASIISHLKFKQVSFRKLEEEKFPVVYTTVFIFILWIAEFFYEGGVPLIKILFRLPYNYRLFGIPTLHVFIVTFSSFFTVYLFHLYLSKRTKLLLILYVLNLSAAMLIYNRGMLFFNLTGSAVIYFMSPGKFSWLRTGIIIGLIVVGLFLFGVLGSLRSSREANEPYNNENFMDVGKATESFRQSVVPKEYFWTFIYVSSPLANFQYNINEHPEPVVNAASIFWTCVNEFLPDFITKRIHAARDTRPAKEWRIGYSFTVHTVYSRAYSYSGWAGMILMTVFVLAFPWLFSLVIGRQSDFFITGWAILCTMYFFMPFDNTFRFTGLSLQLAYPILFAVVEKYFPRKA